MIEIQECEEPGQQNWLQLWMVNTSGKGPRQGGSIHIDTETKP